MLKSCDFYTVGGKKALPPSFEIVVVFEFNAFYKAMFIITLVSIFYILASTGSEALLFSVFI
jgi:hypothetical protein